MSEQKLLLIGCGILQQEIRCLTERNGWALELIFLDSALHINFEALRENLVRMLERHRGQPILVFYGACHPLMDAILEERNLRRVPGQNCLEMLLGPEAFLQELSEGAFFLLEDWARRFLEIAVATFGNNPRIIRDIFCQDRRYLLCLKTPCSSDYTATASKAGELTGLPLRWREVGLEKLESVLQSAIEQWGCEC
ncbi:MAG TPA: DUF1638 domain-containing protein [Patescibacteria group bacterium]|nr:DUF1638 domain-containing protein [Patescibacteria group bacterium]